MSKSRLAYCNLLNGLVPVKVIRTHGVKMGHVVCEVTATRGAYYKGYAFSVPSRWVIPRQLVRGIRGSNPRIIPAVWVWERNPVTNQIEARIKAQAST